MDEYISREATIDKMRSLKSSFRAKNDWDSGYDTAIAEAFEHIKRVPVADVQPVKHGRWIIADDVEHFIAVCSECGRTEDSRGIKDMPYCHCGARMGGDADW